jgi:histidyl-tRNA synthetase
MSKNITQPPRGFRDFLPHEVRRREYVAGVIREVYQRYGFEPVQTPALERLETLLGKYGDEGDQLLFKVLLRGQPLVEGIRSAAQYMQTPGAIVQGRSGETVPGAEKLLADLGLRYDLTVPLARVYSAYQGKLPAVFKCYQIEPVWRADTPGKGRYREFYQCDVDVVGSASRMVEVELASAASQCLTRLGFDAFTLRLNHRGLLRALMESAGVPAHQEAEAIAAIDKLDKIGAQRVLNELSEKAIPEEARQKLLAAITQDAELERVRSLVAENETGRQAIEDITTVLQLSEETPAAGKLRFDVTLARGLEYYTGCIFEVAVADLASSLGGGGRYDNLIGMFLGKAVPACGFSLGLERILVVMDERGLFPERLTQRDIALAVVEEGDRREALRLSHLLRTAGYAVDLRPDVVMPGKLRKYADERAVNFAIWLERGARDKASIWRRMDASVQTDRSYEQIVEIIKTASLTGA